MIDLVMGTIAAVQIGDPFFSTKLCYHQPNSPVRSLRNATGHPFLQGC